MREGQVHFKNISCYMIIPSCIGVAREDPGAMPLLKFVACLIILCFEKRRPKQKYCCLPKVKQFGPSKILG